MPKNRLHLHTQEIYDNFGCSIIFLDSPVAFDFPVGTINQWED